MKDLISEFEFHALWQGKIMPFGSNTFLFMGGGDIQNNLMSLEAREENVSNNKNSPTHPCQIW